jgi:hypothetical protein
MVMSAFMEANGPRTDLALPLHDSLIVPASEARYAEGCIKLAFEGTAGVTVRVHRETAAAAMAQEPF